MLSKGANVMKDRFVATAWHGATYGLRISKNDRSSFVDRDVQIVQLFLPGVGDPIILNVRQTFWTTCPEVRSGEIGRYFERCGLLPWPKGRPPRINLRRLGPTSFEIVE